MTGIKSLPPFDRGTGHLNVIIESPQNCRNKYTYDHQNDLFMLSGVLPAGAVFPFDFGFIPGTLGGDGDPLDVLILMDEPAFVGCLIPARLIGIIEAEQSEGEKMERNDRLIAVAAKSKMYAKTGSITDLSPTVVDEIEHFFISYNAIKDKTFAPLGRFGPEKAKQIVDSSSNKI